MRVGLLGTDGKNEDAAGGCNIHSLDILLLMNWTLGSRWWIYFQTLEDFFLSCWKLFVIFFLVHFCGKFNCSWESFMSKVEAWVIDRQQNKKINLALFSFFNTFNFKSNPWINFEYKFSIYFFIRFFLVHENFHFFSITQLFHKILSCLWPLIHQPDTVPGADTFNTTYDFAFSTLHLV